jgi:hypothetical protein
MPSIFISYRRDDTSGEAGHLAAELRARFGRSTVFIDVDSIIPGVDFEAKITHALGLCKVTFVLIGDRWLTVTNPGGGRRLDDEGDYVRKEIAAAIVRPEVTVVPVLVEGAAMPAEADLPHGIERLAKLNAFELSNKRWRSDFGELSKIALRSDPRWSRYLRGLPRWARRGVPIAVLVAVAATIAVLLTTESGGVNRRVALFPASSPPVVDVCQHQLQYAVNGTAGPLTCENGELNSLAWEYYEHFNPVVMTLSRFATDGQVINAVCADQRNPQMTMLKERDAYRLAALYNGWQFANVPSC